MGSAVLQTGVTGLCHAPEVISPRHTRPALVGGAVCAALLAATSASTAVASTSQRARQARGA